MAQPKSSKLTLKLNSFEASQLNSLQFSYLFGLSRFSDIPNVNDILKSMIAFTLFRIKDGRVLRGFRNNFLKRRNLPPEVVAYEDEFEQSEEDAKLNEITDRGIKRKDIAVELKEPIYPALGNFSLYAGERDLKAINEIKSMISNSLSGSEKEPTNPEIVRECMHFVFDHNIMNMFFRLLTYTGALYGLSPLSSVLVGALYRKSSFPDEVVRYVIDSPLKEDFTKVMAMDKEISLFTEFQEDFNKYPDLNDTNHINQLFGKHISEVGHFDFYMAFIGFDLAYYTYRFNVSEVVDVFIYQRVNSNPDLLEIALDMFGDYLDIFASVSMWLKEEGPPDYDKKISEWVNTS